MRKIFVSWSASLLIAGLLFIGVRPILAQQLDAGLSDYIKANDLQVGTEVVSGYQQVFYTYQGSKHFITNESRNSRSPFTNGRYVAYVSDYNEAGQIFLYDTISDSKTQLTFLGTNLNPRVDYKGRVVWEGWDGNTWQIFFFDGLSTKQLTTGDTSLNPDFSDDYISYGRRDITDTWRAVVYSINDNKSVDVTTGEKARNPKIKNGDIYLAAESLAEEKFSLSVDDLFLLNLAPLSESTESSNIESINTILDELSATPSGVVEIPIATESGSTL